MRKILFFQWNAFMQKGIERAFTYLGMEYDTFYYIFCFVFFHIVHHLS